MADLSDIGVALNGRLALPRGRLETELSALLQDGLARGMAAMRAHLNAAGLRSSEVSVTAALGALRRKGFALECDGFGLWRMTARPVLVLRSIADITAHQRAEAERSRMLIQEQLEARAILRTVSAAAYLSVESLKGPGRGSRLVRARWLAAERMSRRGLSLTQIGRLLHKDHTTVLYGLQQMQRLRCLGLDDAAILRGEGPRAGRAPKGQSHVPARRAAAASENRPGENRPGENRMGA